MASKRQVRQRKCGNKVQHTKESAHRAAAALREKDLERVKPYRCPFCKDLACWTLERWSQAQTAQTS